MFAFLSSHYGCKYYPGLVKGHIEIIMLDFILGTSFMLTRSPKKSSTFLCYLISVVPFFLFFCDHGRIFK